MLKKILIGIGVLFVIGVVASMGSKRPTDTSVVDATRQPAAQSTQSAAVVPVAAAAVLLDEKGNGIKKTKPFTTTRPWTIDYTYDCASFGQKGNFQIYVYELPETLSGIAVNELAASGSDTTNEYGVGQFYLQMNSECDWHVVVKG